VQRVRRLAVNAVIDALSNERYRHDFPRKMRAADELFKSLGAAKQSLKVFRSGSDDVVDDLASVLALTEPYDSDGHLLEWEAEFEIICNRTEDLIKTMDQAIDKYMTAVYRPYLDGGESANATIRFDHGLIGHIGQSWNELYGRKIVRKSDDIKRLSDHVTALMQDFDYEPPPPKVLYDRIRHHRFWK
jgi:hypothetical protein